MLYVPQLSVWASFGDLFHITRFVGRDALSEPFVYHLDLDARDADFDLQALLGETMTVSLRDTLAGPRHFHGHVVAGTYLGRALDVPRFRVELRPWLSLLAHRTECRHFVGMNVLEVVHAVFADYGVLARVDDRCQTTYPQRDFICQFNESDFAFVCRLLQREGIHFFFEHASDEHVLVLSDDTLLATFRDAYESVPLRPVDPHTGDAFAGEHLVSWTPSVSLSTARYVTRNFDFEQPRDPLDGERREDFEHPVGTLEAYVYPDMHLDAAEGAERARRRLEALQTGAQRFAGEGNVRGLAAGSKFRLDGRVTPGTDIDYLVCAITHTIRADEQRSSSEATDVLYECAVEAQPATLPYRPAARFAAPVIPGPQTAIVTGPAGEEIYCDEYGRVKLKFHWDRRSGFDADSSPWIRCAQYMASAGFGAYNLPRVGDEVLVTFLDGDPDRPLITGYVYNALSTRPYSLPEHKTRSGFKSMTIGGGGFNEIRFEDKTGAEQVFVHAERNQDNRVKNDSLEWVGNDRHLVVVANQFEKVEGDKHLSVLGDRSEQVGGTVSLTADMDMQQRVGLKHALDAGQEIHLNAGTNVIIEAGNSITLKAGGAFIGIGPSGLTLVGSPVRINSGGAPGSGSGASPQMPEQPALADTAEPGHRLPPPPPSGLGPDQAMALREAAAVGTPFCEKCEAPDEVAA